MQTIAEELKESGEIMLRLTPSFKVYIALAITEQQLSWILDGLSLEETTAHKEILKRKMI